VQIARAHKNPKDRTLDRLIVGVVLVLVIGIPLVGVIYVMDRYVDPGKPFVERQIATLEETVRQSPNQMNARLQLAGAYRAASRYDDAIAQFTEVLRATAGNDEASGYFKTASLGRADTLRLKGDIAGATSDYQAVVDMMAGQEFSGADTELQAAYYNLGAIDLDAGRTTDAIVALTASLNISPTDSDSLNVLGSAYLAAGDAQQAVDALRKAVLFVPWGWCDPYQSLAAAYTKLDQVAEAEWAGAVVDACHGLVDQANTRLSALVAGPAATDAFLSLGLIAELNGDRTAAADYYRKVLARDQENFNAQAGLGRVADPSASSTPGPSVPAPSAAPEGNG
jgi:tetratricopeptide (TPR) repeat protein